MIDEAEVYRELAPIFAEIFERADIDLAPGLAAKDVQGWDSFKQIELIIATEQRFGIKFASADVDGMRTVGDLVEIVARRGRLA